MKRFIKFFARVIVLSSILFVLAVYLLEIFLLSNSQTLASNKIDKFYSEQSSFDCGILGSSRALGNYVPSILNSKSRNECYNFGLDGTGNKVWYYMLLDELDNDVGRTIIVNVDRSKVPIRNGADFNYNFYLKLPKQSKLFSALDEGTKSQILPWPLYYFGTIKTFLSESLKDHVNVTSVVDNGFKGNINQISNEQFESFKEKDSEFIVEYDEAIWKETFDKIAKSKDSVVFVLAPVYESQITKNDYSNFKQHLGQLSKGYPKINFLDFSNLISDRELFYDPYHLNYNGAVKFSKVLKDSLSNKQFTR